LYQKYNRINRVIWFGKINMINCTNSIKPGIIGCIAFMKNIFLILLILLVVSCSEKQASDQVNTHSEKFIKAAHYFSSAWPKTFWEEFEESQVDNDLQQIKRDGFNTIVLVVPWMGFETGFQNKRTTSNEKLYKRLEFVLSKIKANNLDYILRLGFPHSFAPNLGTNIAQLCTDFYEKPELQDKWLDYLNKVQNITNNYADNLTGILVSWEDFWCPHFVFPHLDENRRKELANEIEYSQWLMQKDLTILKIILGKNEPKMADIAIPTKDEIAYFYYIEFIDKKFNELVLKTTKQVFPQTAMEIRIDKDPVKAVNGEKIWIGHNLYFDEPNHRGTYWAPFWGADNQGEKLSLKQAIFNFEYFLNYVTKNGTSTNHVIEQFNFTDNTPYFPNNASLNEFEVEEFLRQSAPLLKKYSRGYGVWAYRDYADNALYNASFEMGLDGWETQGELKLLKAEGDNQLTMTKNSSISQNYNPHARHMLATSYKQLNLCLKSVNTGALDIYINQNVVAHAILNKGDNCIKFKTDNFISAKQVNFKIVANTNLILDEIKLYGFVQRLGMYDEFDRPSVYVNYIIKLNNQL